jgi:hypothetical protein
MHDVSLLNDVISHLHNTLIFFLLDINYRVLFLSFLINCQDLLLQDSQVLFYSRLALFDKQINLLSES